jgi:predicted nucleic acid-binding protein
MKVVCDTSSIIKLQRGGIIDCLGQLFEVVLIPRAVKEECTRPETKAVLQKPFFQIHTVASPLPLSGIHIGELEAISLAVEHNIPVIILDDEKAFERALEQGLVPIRSFRVLLFAKGKVFSEKHGISGKSLDSRTSLANEISTIKGTGNFVSLAQYFCAKLNGRKVSLKDGLYNIPYFSPSLHRYVQRVSKPIYPNYKASLCPAK